MTHFTNQQCPLIITTAPFTLFQTNPLSISPIPPPLYEPASCSHSRSSEDEASSPFSLLVRLLELCSSIGTESETHSYYVGNQLELYQIASIKRLDNATIQVSILLVSKKHSYKVGELFKIPSVSVSRHKLTLF